jgi:hypothetical protein
MRRRILGWIHGYDETTSVYLFSSHNIPTQNITTWSLRVSNSSCDWGPYMPSCPDLLICIGLIELHYRKGSDEDSTSDLELFSLIYSRRRDGGEDAYYQNASVRPSFLYCLLLINISKGIICLNMELVWLRDSCMFGIFRSIFLPLCDIVCMS